MEDWEREYYWKLMDACDARAGGDNRAALRFLDEADHLFATRMGELPMRKIHAKRGRPVGAKRKRADPDEWTLVRMQWISKQSGIKTVETLAREMADFSRIQPRIYIGASRTAFIKRLSAKYRRLAKK